MKKSQKIFVTIALSFFIICTLFTYIAPSSAVEQSIVKTFSFEIGWNKKKHYQIEVEIPSETYNYYATASHPYAIIEHNNNYEFHFSKYVAPESLGNLPDLIASYTNGGEEEVANAVLNFVQNIDYVSDEYQVENTLYPIETLVLGGCCDDLSILYATLMYVLDYDLVFLNFPDQHHLCVGVHLSHKPTHTIAGISYWLYEGKEYYYAETTSVGWRVGELSKDLESAYIVKVTSTFFPLRYRVYAEIDPYSFDSDADNLSDGQEIYQSNTDPYNSDTDGDELSDYYEIYTSTTNPTNSDTDNDGLFDGEEITAGSNPLISDSDGDGLTDGEEVTRGTSPIKTDTDNDLWDDSIDLMPTDSLVPNLVIVIGIGGVFIILIFLWKRSTKQEIEPISSFNSVEK